MSTTYVGSPCKRGHNGVRYMNGGACVECMRKQNAAYRAGHAETHRQAVKDWKAAHREEHLAALQLWRSKHGAETRQHSKNWRKRNPEANRAKARRYAERKAGADGACSDIQLQARIDLYGGLCWVPGCGKVYEAIDHVIPLAKGGSAWPANLRPICKRHNSSKKDRAPREFVHRIEMKAGC